MSKPRYEYFYDKEPDLAPPHCVRDNATGLIAAGAYSTKEMAQAVAHGMNEAHNRMLHPALYILRALKDIEPRIKELREAFGPLSPDQQVKDGD